MSEKTVQRRLFFGETTLRGSAMWIIGTAIGLGIALALIGISQGRRSPQGAILPPG
jgi:hypothetical protein